MNPANAQVHIFSDRVEIVYRMDLVENVGSGIKRIKEALAADKLPEPVLDVDENWFSIVFPRIDRSFTPTVSQKGSLKTSEKTSEKILRLVEANNLITISELSLALGISTRSIERNIEKLQSLNRIMRVGPDKGGHWEVMD